MDMDLTWLILGATSLVGERVRDLREILRRRQFLREAKADARHLILEVGVLALTPKEMIPRVLQWIGPVERDAMMVFNRVRDGLPLRNDDLLRQFSDIIQKLKEVEGELKRRASG